MLKILGLMVYHFPHFLIVQYLLLNSLIFIANQSFLDQLLMFLLEYRNISLLSYPNKMKQEYGPFQDHIQQNYQLKYQKYGNCDLLLILCCLHYLR
jgi:hypothetical protein